MRIEGQVLRPVAAPHSPAVIMNNPVLSKAIGKNEEKKVATTETMTVHKFQSTE